MRWFCLKPWILLVELEPGKGGDITSGWTLAAGVGSATVFGSIVQRGVDPDPTTYFKEAEMKSLDQSALASPLVWLQILQRWSSTAGRGRFAGKLPSWWYSEYLINIYVREDRERAVLLGVECGGNTMSFHHAKTYGEKTPLKRCRSTRCYRGCCNLLQQCRVLSSHPSPFSSSPVNEIHRLSTSNSISCMMCTYLAQATNGACAQTNT